MDHRPNSLLQPDERCRKLHLKRLLKEQHLLYKYTMRHCQALRRHEDAATVQATLSQLQAYQEAIAASETAATTLEDPFVQRIGRPWPGYLVRARVWVEQFYQHIQSESPCPTFEKETQRQTARTLLRHMTKGTQELRLFDDRHALLGYTRHKFIERAGLVLASLENLREYRGSIAEERTSIVATAMIQRLHRVRRLISVGCGPGCDAVGLVAWLRAIREEEDRRDAALDTTTTIERNHNKEENQLVVLESIRLLDWAMEQWFPIVESVKVLLTQKYGLVQEISLESCDVRQAPPLPTGNGPSFTDDAHSLVVVSYLFSETRNAWYPFFDDCVARCPGGTLFLLTDPTAWQLHIFRERYEYTSSSQGRRRQMEFQWLDSSMHRPELQELEGRNGPAVLLAMKIDDTMDDDDDLSGSSNNDAL